MTMTADNLDTSNDVVTAVSIAAWWRRMEEWTFKGATMTPQGAVTARLIDEDGNTHVHTFQRGSDAYVAMKRVLDDRRKAAKKQGK